jgi:hypothetical protein
MLLDVVRLGQGVEPEHLEVFRACERISSSYYDRLRAQARLKPDC